MNDGFQAAMSVLDRVPDRPDVYCDVFLGLFPVSGAAVSTLGDLLGSETLAASDVVAARLDELQFDLGEGPCWDAMRSGDPVLQPDMHETGKLRWPAFSAAIHTENIRSLFAFPLTVGPLRFGAIDLYSDSTVTLDPTQTRQASAMADVVSKHVMRNALSSIGLPTDDVGNAYSRRLVHQATGMVLAQLDVSPDDARLVIQGHAYAVDESMMDIAQDIIAGRLRFTRDGTRIEVAS